MTILSITADQLSAGGKAWVDAFAAIMGAIIAQAGILLLAGIAVYQNINKQLPPEVKERLDRYNDRLDRVAIATVAAAPEEKKVEVAAAVARTPVSDVTEKPSEVSEPANVTEQPKPEPIKPEQL